MAQTKILPAGPSADRSENNTVPIITLKSGISLYYEEQGCGEPLILIAGAGADHTAWVVQVPDLSKSYRVITFDSRGIGRSTCPERDEEYSAAIMAQDVVELMDELSITSSHLMGQSLGSAVAQEVALAQRERVISLQLVVTWAKSDVRIQKICSTMRTLLSKASLEEYYYFCYAIAFSPALLEAQPLFLEQYYRSSIDENGAVPSMSGLMGHWHAVNCHDAADRLSTLKIPVLVTAGEGDILVHQEYGKRVAELIPGAYFHCFGGPCSSHLLHIEMAPLFNSLSMEFLRNNKDR
ncbi:MAG: alpha/beta fold hydrolase [Candidatus Xenobiia bacterium LiM19]